MVILCTYWSTTICITCLILHEIECNNFVCNKFVLVLLQIVLQFVHETTAKIKSLSLKKLVSLDPQLRGNMLNQYWGEKKLIPYKPHVRGEQVESILGTWENMIKNVFNLNNMIPHNVRLVDPLQELVTPDLYIYCKIRKGMYGLPQAGIIAQELLVKRLAKQGYHQSKIITRLWTHETRTTTFTLVVDVFAIKIMSEDNANHIINTLKKH